MASRNPNEPLHWQTLESMLAPKAHDRNTLSGFDDEFADITDYILKITHRIWEQKNVGLCYDYYADTCPVYTLGAYSDSVEDVVQATTQMMATFPDRTLLGDNVIWSQDEDGTWYSSHRLTSTMTHAGPSDLGPPTGLSGWLINVADCVCENNRIVREWLVRDYSFLVKQFGIDPLALARQRAQQEPGDDFRRWWQEEYDRVSQVDHRKPLGDTDSILSPARFAEHWLHDLLNRKRFGRVSDLYWPNARQRWPGGRQAIGHRAITGTLIQWLSGLEQVRASCDHIASIPFNEHTADIALRWTLTGRYAAKTPQDAHLHGLPVMVLAVTHLRVREGRIEEEWTVFDEVALMANLYRQERERSGHA